MSVINNKSRGVRAEYEIKKYLQSNDYFVFSKRVSQSGPEIIAIKDKRAIVMEVKSTKLSSIKIKNTQINSLLKTASEISEKQFCLQNQFLLLSFQRKMEVGPLF